MMILTVLYFKQFKEAITLVPKIIEYTVQGNVLTPLVYVDLNKLIGSYDSYMINVKQVRRGKRRA